MGEFVDKQMFLLYNELTRNQTTNERRAVQTNDTKSKRIPNNTIGGDNVFAYCDHCGFAIYGADDVLVIKANGDRIHRDCFSEYAEEHLFEFSEKAEENERFGCGF